MRKTYFKFDSMQLYKILVPAKVNKKKEREIIKVSTYVMFFFKHDSESHELENNVHFYKTEIHFVKVENLEGKMIFHFMFPEKVFVASGVYTLIERSFKAEIIDFTPYDKIFETELVPEQQEIIKEIKLEKVSYK